MAIIKGRQRTARHGWLADNGGECKNRIGRGGSWSNTPTPLRSAYRDGNTADARLDNLGVRVARTLDVP